MIKKIDIPKDYFIRYMRILNRYSRAITQEASQGASQAMLYATITQKTSANLDKPFVGICATWLSRNPCNMHLHKYSNQIAKSVEENQMVSAQFNTTGVSDGIAMGTDGMRYSLPSRELICDSVETTMRGLHYDGFIGIPGCDKNIPAMLMALLRLDRPGFLVYGGSIRPGSYRKKERVTEIDVVSAFQSYGEKLAGTITEEERKTIVRNACPGPGACGGMYTANTMAVFSEVLGLMQTNSSSNLAESPEKIQELDNCGTLMNHLLAENITPRMIVTRESLQNALIVATALGGSTNMILHVLAIAHEAGIPLTLRDVKEIVEPVPLIGNFKPSGDYVMKDLYELGGTRMVTKYLLDAGLLDGNCLTISGKTLKEEHKNTYALAGQDIIYPVSSPIKSDGHLRILTGNLAPDGCVAKITGKEGEYFSGPAIVFDSEDEMVDAARNGDIQKGMVVVIRYQGPTIGMPEMLKPTSILAGMGLLDKVALITDGRFSGGSHGFIIGHISPEGYSMGEIIRIANGDQITIDIQKKTITAESLSVIVPKVKPRPKLQGYLQKFSKLVRSASDGCRTVE